jgi:hypothetical protein
MKSKCTRRLDKNIFVDRLENPDTSTTSLLDNSSGFIDSRLDIPNRMLFFYEDRKIVGAK